MRRAVQHYFDAMMQAKPDHLRRAFHSNARLIGLNRDGGVSVENQGTAASVKTDL